MNFNIGAKIKAMRLAASMTQKQLAGKLGVSAQAVSKWESGTNMPDIQILPDLSVIFGVTIDSLFDMTDESKMERLENMMYGIRFLSEEDFRNAESYLKDSMGKEKLEGEATLLLAELYNKRANEYHELWPLDLLIADGRTSEAREYAEAMKKVEHSYHYEMYMGHICKAECDLPTALDWWQKMTEHSPEKWIVWAEYADCMVKLCRYEEAILAYKKAMPMRPKPRFYDCEQSVAHIMRSRATTGRQLK